MEWGFFFFFSFFFFFYIETCFQTNVIICLCFNCSSCNTIANDNDMLVQILIHKLELILRKMIILLWFNSYPHLPVLLIWSDRLYIVYRYLTCHPILPGKFFCMVHLHVYKWSTFLYTFFSSSFVIRKCEQCPLYAKLICGPKSADEVRHCLHANDRRNKEEEGFLLFP